MRDNIGSNTRVMLHLTRSQRARFRELVVNFKLNGNVGWGLLWSYPLFLISDFLSSVFHRPMSQLIN